MTISVLQERPIDTAGAVASISLAFSTNLTAGSSISECGSWGGATAATQGTFSDNHSGVHATIATQLGTGTTQSCSLGNADNVAAGACTVTFTPPTTIAFVGIAIREIGGTSGYDTGSGTAVERQTPGTATDGIKGVSTTPSVGPGLVSAFFADLNNADGMVAGTGYTAGLANTSWPNIGALITEHLRYTGTAAQQPTATDATSGAAHNYIVSAAFYKESGAVAARNQAMPIPATGPGVQPGKNANQFRASPRSTDVLGAPLTVALSGATSTSAAGTLIPNISVPLTGQAVTSAVGVLGANLSAPLTGQAATFAAGTLAPSLTVPLLGQAMSAGPGSLSVLGLATTGFVSQPGPGVGPFSNNQFQAAPRGLTPTIPTVTAALTGQSAAFSGGALGPATAVALTGQPGTFAPGTLVPGLSLSLSGQGATFGAGLLSANLAVALTGQAGTFSAGTLTNPNDVRVALTGQAAAFTSGSLTGGIDLALTGSLGAFLPGKLTVLQLAAIPQVQGLPLATATAILVNDLFIVGTLTYTVSPLPVGDVVVQSPVAGTIAPVGTAVALELSQGLPTPIITPIRPSKLPNLPNTIIPPQQQLVDERGVIHPNWWRFLLNVSQQAFGTNTTSPATVTVTGSPFVLTASHAGSVIVAGGPVSLIEYSKDGKTWFPTGQSAGVFQMAPNDSLRITYTNAPAVTFFPR